MKLFRLNTINADRRYVYVDAPIPVGAEVELAQPAKPKMERLEIDALELFMDEDMGGLELADYVTNTSNILPLSNSCLAAITGSFDLGEHELLPCRIINRKKRVHSADYSVVNFVGKVHCLDEQRSELNPHTEFLHVQFMGKWYLEAARVPPERDLFRVDGVIGFIFSERLVDHITSAGYTNFKFDPVVTT